MRHNRVYICHPQDTHQSGIQEFIADAVDYLRLESSWDDWDIIRLEYDKQLGFSVQPLAAKVMHRAGPVVLLEPVQTSAARRFSAWLQSYTTINQTLATSADDVYAVLCIAKRRFEAKEPYLPRKFVAAILLVRKLRKGNYWGGKAKGYLWRDELAQGRGVDDRYADIIQNVAELLVQHGILIFKISQGVRKYALNPHHKPDVHAIADRREFRDSKLLQKLTNDRNQISAHELLEPNELIRMELTGSSSEKVVTTAAQRMLSEAANYGDCDSYLLQIVFEGGRTLRESFTSKAILIQFIEAFL